METMFFLIFVWFCVCSGKISANEEIKAHPGDTVVLPCRCPEAASSVLMVKVIKHNQEDDRYCFFYRENRVRESTQHPSFKGRVHLNDSQMTNGDFSVVLGNVSLSDTGTYECVVGYAVAGRSDGESFRHVNHLTVEDGHIRYGGHIGLILLAVLLFFCSSVLLLLFLIMTFIFKSQRNCPSCCSGGHIWT